MPPKKKLKLKPEPNQRKLFEFVTDVNNNALYTATPLDLSSLDLEEKEKPLTERKCWGRWTTTWGWLYAEKGLMFCKACVSKGKKNSFTEGCTNYRTSTMSRHEEIEDHIEATDPGKLAANFERAVSKVFSEEEEAVMQAIKAVIWMANENLPLSKYESLRGLLGQLNVPKIGILERSDRVKYDSYYSATEILHSICDFLDERLNNRLTKSPCISVLADESTDVANKKRMTLNAILIDPETSRTETVYLRTVEYEDGSGVGLAGVIFEECRLRNIPFDKVIGFGSDGASVMTGSGKGVKGILLRKQPHLIHVHCMAHRLALCTSQAAESVPCIKIYQRWLTNLFYYFKASSSREQELHKVQEVLQHPILKYKEVHAVRWLSCYETVRAVYRTLDPLMTYFHQRKAANDPKSKGLLKTMATTDFIFITYLLMDVLPIVSKLCLKFQERDLDVIQAKVAINYCLADLTALRDGNQMFPTQIEKYQEDVVEVNGRYEFSGHVLVSKTTNLNALKSKLINNLLSNLDKRFPQKTLLDSFFVLGMRSINFDSNPRTYGNDELEEILKHFGEEKTHTDVTSPPLVNKDDVRREWGLAKQTVRDLKYPVDRFPELWELLTREHSREFPNLIRIAQFAAVLPLHTADCERVFSQQNKIITKHRARLSALHLDQLLKVRLSKKGYMPFEIDVEGVMNIWRHKKKRCIFKS